MTKSYFKVCSAGGAYFFFHDATLPGRRDALSAAREKVKELMGRKMARTPPPIEDSEIPRKVVLRTPALSSWLPDPDVQQIGMTHLP